MKRKYRIKMKTMKNNRRVYYPQVKFWWFPLWLFIDYDGDTSVFAIETHTKHSANERIKKHMQGNGKVVKTTYEKISIKK